MYPNDFRTPPRRDMQLPIPQRPVQQTHPQPNPALQQQTPPQQQYRQEQGRSILPTILIIVLILVFIGGAGYGGFYYANFKNKKTNNSSQAANAAQGQQLATNEGDTNSLNTAQPSIATHFVTQAGFPYDLGAKKVFTVSLGLPSTIQGVGIDSGNNNRGEEQYYTDKYNDEIARWTIGYADYPQDSSSRVSVLAISKSWLALKQQGNHAFDDTNVPLDTPEQKQAYITKIKADAQTCVKDKAKGFTTKDGTLNVCFSVIPGISAYTPILVLRGYGEIEKQPVLFVGSVRLIDGKTYDDAANKKLLADAKAGKLAESTVKEIDTVVSSLNQTTIKSSANAP